LSLVEVRHVSCLFHRPDGSVLCAIDDVSLDVPRGRTVAVIGESGSGKSTLARLILGVYKTAGGSVCFDGTDIATLSKEAMRKLRARIGVVFQEPFESLNPRMRIGAIIEEPLVVHQPSLSREARRAKVADILREVDLDPIVADRYPASLSGGQQQRIGIARALIGEPSLVVLDEPTSSLDLSVRAQVLVLLAKLQKARGLTYLMITHDIASVEYFADEVLVMYRGQIVERGPTAQVLNHPQEAYTQRLLSARLSVEV
jgi:ABC-type microcin C transport system duplicated ATPase subunit YejF